MFCQGVYTLSYGKCHDVEKFSTLPHHLENALRFPHFPQHNNNIHKFFIFLIKQHLFYVRGIVQRALCPLFSYLDVFFDSYRTL